jgi:hypothetical protein
MMAQLTPHGECSFLHGAVSPPCDTSANPVHSCSDASGLLRVTFLVNVWLDWKVRDNRYSAPI